MAWTTVELVRGALGASTPIADADYLAQCVDAANALAYRKRKTAGYVDDPDVAPDAAVAMGATLYAVALWRERAATDGYPSFDDLSGFTPTGGSWAQIKKLLAIPRGRTDYRDPLEVTPYRARRMRVFRR
jgi:hypothetical protein